MASKVCLTIFLALSLAVQGTSISIQIENGQTVSTLVQTRLDIHVAGNDLDDEQRGAKFYLAVLRLPFEATPVSDSPQRGCETKFPAAKRPLFKLKAVFLI